MCGDEGTVGELRQVNSVPMWCSDVKTLNMCYYVREVNSRRPKVMHVMWIMENEEWRDGLH